MVHGLKKSTIHIISINMSINYVMIIALQIQDHADVIEVRFIG